MAYCTTADVQGLVTQMTFTASTKPTTTQVSTWIDEVTAEVDGILATADYPTGLTAGSYPESYKVLTSLCAREVASRAVQASQFGVDPALSEQAAQYHADYLRGLSNIRSMPNYLHDAASEGVGGGARMRGYQDDNSDAPDALFTIDEEF